MHSKRNRETSNPVNLFANRSETVDGIDQLTRIRKLSQLFGDVDTGSGNIQVYEISFELIIVEYSTSNVYSNRYIFFLGNGVEMRYASEINRRIFSFELRKHCLRLF